MITKTTLSQDIPNSCKCCTFQALDSRRLFSFRGYQHHISFGCLHNVWDSVVWLSSPISSSLFSSDIGRPFLLSLAGLTRETFPILNNLYNHPFVLRSPIHDSFLSTMSASIVCSSLALSIHLKRRIWENFPICTGFYGALRKHWNREYSQRKLPKFLDIRIFTQFRHKIMSSRFMHIFREKGYY